MEVLNRPETWLRRLAVTKDERKAFFHWSDRVFTSYPVEKKITAKGPTSPLFPVRLEKALSLLAQARAENTQNLLEQTTTRSPGVRKRV